MSEADLSPAISMSFLEIKIGVTGEDGIEEAPDIQQSNDSVGHQNEFQETTFTIREEDESEDVRSHLTSDELPDIPEYEGVTRTCGVPYTVFEDLGDDGCIQTTNPAHPGNRTWENMVVFFIVLHALLVMFMVAFDSTSIFMWLVVWFCDCLNLVDILSTFCTAYVNSKGIPVRDKRNISKKYVTTTFFPDLISVLPTELFVLIANEWGPWKMLAICRLNRLVRLYKVFFHFESREAELATNTNRMRYIKYFTMCMLVTHGLACVWYALGCTGIYDIDGTDVRECFNGTWAVRLESVIGFKMQNTSSVDAYVVSLYWAVATATSTGYGDISAATVGERIFATCAMLVGIFVFYGLLMGGMTSMLTNADTRRAKFAHRLNIIKDNLLSIGVAQDLVSRTIGFYDYLWLRKKGVQDEGIYDCLPRSFQAEISHVTNAGILQKAPIFRGLGEGFLRMLSLNIKHMLFLPRQIIIKRGDVGTQMFFIHRGMVEVLSEDDEDTPVATLKSGKLFGEVSLVYSMPRTATIRAATHCDLMALDRYDLNMILVHYPEINKKLQEEAKARCRFAERIAERQSNPNDNNLDENPHFKATHRRRSSYVPQSHIQRKSFAPEIIPGLDQLHPMQLRRTSSNMNRIRRQSMAPGVQKHKQRRGTLTMTDSVDLLRTDGNEMEDLAKFVSKHQASRNPFSAIGRCFGWLKKQVKSYTVDPESEAKYSWDSFIMLITFVICIIYPYFATFTAFEPRKGYHESDAGISILSLTYILDILLCFDIFVNLRTNVYTVAGQSSLFKEIVKRYVHSMWFVVDLVSVLPLELLCIIEPETEARWRLYCVLRLNRLFKFLKVMKIMNAREQTLHANLGRVRAFKLCTYVLVLSHWIACALYSMACFGDVCYDKSWIVNWSVNKRGYETGVNETTPSTEYITSLYWAAATMTSTGYGDIIAGTTHGRFIALCAMLFGFLVYGYCLALMAATLGNADAPKVRFQERIFGMRDFMVNHKLSLDLQERVVGYLSLLWDRYRGEWMPGEESLVHDSPLALQQDIALEDAYKTLAKVPLFKDTDDTFIRMIAMRATTYMFNPGDIIVYAGDMGREMYCIRRGSIEIMDSDMKICLASMGEGQYFGEVGMIFGDYRTATAIAKTHAETIMLTMDDLEDVLKGFPLLKEQFQEAQRNEQFLRDLQNSVLKREIGSSFNYDDLVQVARQSLAKSSTLRVDVKQRITAQQSVTSFRDTDITGNVNEDYMEPFKEIHPISRCFSKLLMPVSFLPIGKGLKVWTFVMLIVAVMNAILVPIQGAFLHQNLPLWVVGYVLDIFNWINIYIGFHIAFYNEENVIVTHPLSTAKNYLKTNFCLDMICCFPFEVFAYAAYPDFEMENVHLFALVRLNRILQIYKLPLAFNYLEDAVDRESGRIREVKFSFYTVIFINFMTCIVFLMSCPPYTTGAFIATGTGHQCYDPSWITNTAVNITTADSWSLFLVSVYWTTATTVSVGYGEISAFTDLEMFMSMLMMICGILFFGYIVAAVAASLANADAQRARFQEKLNSIKLFMQDQKINEPLQKRVLDHYRYVWLRTRGVDADNLFNGLPYSLWGDVTMSLYRDIIAKISLFQDTEMSFIKMLSRCIKPMLFMKGEYVVKKHDIGQEMFFIHRGAVDVTSEDGAIIFDVMNAGAAFGEVALLFSCPRTACIRASVNSDVFCLAKKDLDRVLNLYPAIKNQVMSIAEERRQQARKRSAAKIAPVKESLDANGEEQKDRSNMDLSHVPSDTSTEGDTNEALEEELKNTEISAPQPSVPSSDGNNKTQSLIQIAEERSSMMAINSSAALLYEQELAGREGRNMLDQMSDDDDDNEEGDFKDMHNINGNNINNDAMNQNRNNTEDEELKQTESVQIKTNCFYNGCQRLAKLNRFTINPDNKAYVCFANLRCVASFIVCWIVTYQAFFQDFDPVIIAASYFCDFLFWLDIYLNFHLEYVDDYGVLVDDFIAIRKNYMRRINYFCLDLCSVIPLEVFAGAFSSKLRMMALSFFRLTRLLRMAHINRFFSKWEQELDVNMMFVRTLRSLQNLLHTVHFVACIWYVIACPLKECINRSWADLEDLSTTETRYCSSLYWAVATMTSTGYGDIRAYTQLEMIVAVIVMILGKLLFGFILGNFASTQANAEANKVAYEEKLEAVRNTMEDQAVPWSLQHRVISYFDYLWMRNKGVDIKDLFHDCPSCLKSELFLEIARPMFKAISLLGDAEDSFLRQLCMKVQIMLFMPGDYIVKKGDVGSEVMYIYDGDVLVTTTGEKEDGETLGPGDVFGEINMMRNLPREVSVRAITHVDVFSLSRTDLEEVQEFFPSEQAKILQIAIKRFGDILTDNDEYQRRLSKVVKRLHNA